jgi:lipopolysaccharide cholinephosphotransferase
MKEYDEATLKAVQKLEMGILKDFLKICDEYHLTSFGFAGTGIGALRHKGFIPWDDDIDIALPRKDYEKLLEVIKRDYSHKYNIGNAEEMKNYPLMTTRIMLKGTKFVEESMKDVKCKLGIFLDVYAFDNTPDDDKAFQKQARKAWFWSKLLILRHVAHPVLPFRGALGKVIDVICGFVHGCMCFFHVSHDFLYRKCKEACCRYNGKKTNRIAFFCGTKPYSNLIDLREAMPFMELPFEDVTIQFPKNIDKILRDFYGDYMQLPPVEKRKNHYPYCLKLPAGMNKE